jgi:hypothetical protein
MRDMVKELLPHVDKDCRKNIKSGINLLKRYANGEDIDTKSSEFRGLIQRISMASDNRGDYAEPDIATGDKAYKRRRHAEKVSYMLDLINAEIGIDEENQKCIIRDGVVMMPVSFYYGIVSV